MATAINNGHGLQTHALHVDLSRQQEAMVEIVEKLGTFRHNVFASDDRFCVVFILGLRELDVT